ncbi:MAG: hypothetical protein ACRDL4_11490 [Thermoleophilaceae bacterium]
MLSSLDRHGVAFVLIGGVAVGAHGYVRATEDLDVVPDPTAENLRRLGNGLVALDATLPLAGGRSFTPARDVTPLRRGQSMTLDTRHGPLDIVQRVPGVPGYAELERDAITSDLLGVPVRVCSLEHLRRMKEARRGAQDIADLERLPLTG